VFADSWAKAAGAALIKQTASDRSRQSDIKLFFTKPPGMIEEKIDREFDILAERTPHAPPII
jgi:hypothetical protein